MSDDTFKPISGDRPATTAHGDGSLSAHDTPSGDAGRALLVGVVGGVVSAVGYLVYSRLPDEQRERIHAQARQLVESRINELRGRFNI